MVAFQSVVRLKQEDKSVQSSFGLTGGLDLAYLWLLCR